MGSSNIALAGGGARAESGTGLTFRVPNLYKDVRLLLNVTETPEGASVDFESYAGLTSIYEAVREAYAHNDPVPTISDFSPSGFDMDALGVLNPARATFKTGGPGGLPFFDFGDLVEGYAGTQKDTDFYGAQALTIVAVVKAVPNSLQSQFPIGTWNGDATPYLVPPDTTDLNFPYGVPVASLWWPNAAWVVVGFRLGAGTFFYRKNGDADGSQPLADLGLLNNNDPDGGRIGIAGGSSGHAAGNWSGAIAAIATYDVKLSDADMDALMAAKVAQYSIT